MTVEKRGIRRETTPRRRDLCLRAAAALLIGGALSEVGEAQAVGGWSPGNGAILGTYATSAQLDVDGDGEFDYQLELLGYGQVVWLSPLQVGGMNNRIFGDDNGVATAFATADEIPGNTGPTQDYTMRLYPADFGAAPRFVGLVFHIPMPTNTQGRRTVGTEQYGYLLAQVINDTVTITEVGYQPFGVVPVQNMTWTGIKTLLGVDR